MTSTIINIIYFTFFDMFHLNFFENYTLLITRIDAQTLTQYYIFFCIFFSHFYRLLYFNHL